MNVVNTINVEIYSIVLLLFIMINYMTKFRKNLATELYVWLFVTLCSIFISISHIVLGITDIYFIRLISIIIYILSTILATLSLYIYISNINLLKMMQTYLMKLYMHQLVY